MVPKCVGKRRDTIGHEPAGRRGERNVRRGKKRIVFLQVPKLIQFS
jgi:hypothetical protein